MHRTETGGGGTHWYHHNNYRSQKLQADSVHMCFVWHRELSPVPRFRNRIHIYSIVHRPPGHNLPCVHIHTFYVLITHVTTTQMRAWMFPVPHQPPSSPALTSPRWEKRRLLFWNLSPRVYNGTTQYIFLGLTFQKEEGPVITILIACPKEGQFAQGSLSWLFFGVQVSNVSCLRWLSLLSSHGADYRLCSPKWLCKPPSQLSKKSRYFWVSPLRHPRLSRQSGCILRWLFWN